MDEADKKEKLLNFLYLAALFAVLGLSIGICVGYTWPDLIPWLP